MAVDAMEILDLTTLGSWGTFLLLRGITTNGTNLFWTDTSTRRIIYC